MNPKHYKILFVFSILFFLSGCAENIIYRSEFTTCAFHQEGDCEKAAIQHHGANDEDEYYLGFMEFDDQGQLRKREQMQAVLDQYYPIAGQNDVLLIVFAHGWHHNAKPGDSNIQEFRKLLARISQIETENSRLLNQAERKVMGVYVGWRGESITVPLLKELTFWERKGTAHDVGLQGVTEVLLKLEEIVNVKAGIETEVPKPLNSRLVVIGHSFGGAVIYTSLQQVLADRFVDSRRGKTYSDTAKGFGDLVVLVNPAFEALRFATLYDISQQNCRRYFPEQLPRMAILTSESDNATKYAFPLGRFFSTLFETHNTLERHYCAEQGPVKMGIKEGKADRNTVGHFQPYLTHDLLPTEKRIVRGKDFNYRDLQNAWAQQQAKGVFEFESTRLVHLDRTRPLNPYLNIKVNKNLIADHNDIWGDEIVSFIRDLIIISTLPVKAAGK